MQILNRRAQNIMEYTLLMAGAVALSIVALRQGGLVDKKVAQSLDISVSGVECMALNTCYDPNGCPVTCGNGCCETHGETAGSCWADCECANPAECDDGVYCNGVEECGGNEHCRYGPSLSVGTDAGLCVECDGGGGERAVVDDPDCGTIDCGGNNYFHHTGPTADATDVETCFLREFAAITSGRCDGIRKCKNPDSANCTAYGDQTEYFCDTCKYIATSDCTGTFLGGCSNSDTSAVCGTRVCDLNDVACRDYHDVTRYCDGGGNCATPACDSYTNQDTSTTCGTEDCDYLDAVTACRDYYDVTKYCDGLGGCATPACDSFTNAAAGTIVKLCTECDGGGGERAAPDDNACGVLACSDLSYYEQTGTESPVDTEYCNSYAYTNMLTDRCEGMNDCKDVGVVGATDCVVPAPTQPYSCGTCKYIAPGDCEDKNLGGCTDYAAGTDTGVCAECNGAGAEQTPADDGACGTIDCDGRDVYIQNGTESPTATETCTFRDYTDITNNRCEDLRDCKDANTADCTASTDTDQYTCGTCQYIDASNCTGTTRGGCTNYGVGTDTGLCSECDGSGAQRMAADDAGCGTIGCAGMNYYYQSGTESATAEEICYYRTYANITGNRCEGIDDCKDADTSDCTSYSDGSQYTCGVCKYIDASSCTGTTAGGCTNYAAGTSCGGDSVCDGSGNCALQQCLAAPMAVSVNGLTGNFATTDVGSTSTSTCPSGYNGSPTRWCNAVANAANGSWGALQNPCMRNCQAGNQAVGNEGQTGWFGETSVGQTATSSCPSGSANNSNGLPYRSCNADSNNDGFGEWGSLQNACVPNACGTTPTVNNATPSAQSGTFPHTTVKTVSCNTGCAGGSKNIKCDFGSWKWVEADGTLSNTALACSGIDGSWGAPWTTWSDSAGFSDGSGGTCSKACDTGTQSRTGTCNASCGGSCPAGGDIETQNCNTQACCGNGSCDDGNGGRPNYGESCSNCSDDCGACCVPTTCGASDCGVISDGCTGTIDCGTCDCPGPSNTTILNNSSTKYYSYSGGCGNFCNRSFVWQTWSCSNGTVTCSGASSTCNLNGIYKYTSCTVTPCPGDRYCNNGNGQCYRFI